MISELIEELIDNADLYTKELHDLMYRAADTIEMLSKKVREQKQGKWILSFDEQYEYCTCSECGYENGENWMIGSDIPYCQNCGAKMQGVNNDISESY